MEEKVIQILEHAGRLFLKYGIKSLTMDDIANELKISKKTLYQYVTDKQDLVTKTMILHCENDRRMVEELSVAAGNAIDELLSISMHVKSKFALIHPSIHYDLEKYYPEAWQLLQKHQLDFVYEKVKLNIERGKKEGLFLEDVNEEIIARIYVARIDAIIDRSDAIIGKYEFPAIYHEIIRYHIRGIASEKGYKYLNQKLKSL